MVPKRTEHFIKFSVFMVEINRIYVIISVGVISHCLILVFDLKARRFDYSTQL